MHRSLLGTATAATTLSFCLLTTAAHGAGAPTMFLSDVRPGMECTVSSVIQGIEPTTFNATVIGVEGGPRPSDSLIIARFSGDAIASTGIGQGFSGSPVTCPGPDGVPRVIGAISQGIGQYDNFVAGLTPIEAMLATPTFGDAPAAPPVGDASPAAGAGSAKKKARRAAGSAAPWGTGRTPLTLSGPRGPLASALQAAGAKADRPLLIAPTATRMQVAATGLKPGDAVSATTVSGDISAGAVGTVTYVDGDRVWAFGHPFSGTGPSRLAMDRARISTVIASPAIGEQVTYKLGAPIAPAGTVGFDGVSAIGGVLGARPGTIPVGATIKNAAGAVVQQANAAIVDERPVRGGSTGGLLPLATAANAGTAVQRLTSQASAAGSARTCTRILLKNGQKPLEQCVDSIVTQPGTFGGVETGVADAAGAAVSGVTSGERYLRLVDRVQVDVTMRGEADTLEIVRVKQPTRIRAGRTATVRVVVVQGSTGDRREIPIQVRIPRFAAGQRTGIVILSGAAGASEEGGGGLLDALFSELFEGGSVVPKSLDALREQYTNDGVSGLRAVVLPGFSGSEARELLTGDSEETDLDEEEFQALFDEVKLVRELPTYSVEGAASTTVRPTR
ncbi:MAG: hypothetical protein JHD16_08260 [Solirubrobacteraceae bacterium]|nr:hypothetical protein [Solirubrobacteraceae bacterium]